MDAKYIRTSIAGGIPSGLLNGLLAYWKLDETSGTTLYDELVNKNITTTGTVNQVGKLGRAVDISLGECIELSYDGTVNFNQSQFTVCFWYYPSSTASTLGRNIYLIYVRTTSDFPFRLIQVSASNYFGLIVKNSSLAEYYSDSDQAFNTSGAWMHIGVVFRGNGYQTQLYVNGVDHTASYSPVFSGSILAQDNYTTFGNSQPGNTSNSIDGLFDEIALYSRALSSLEMADHFNSDTGKTHPFS